MNDSMKTIAIDRELLENIIDAYFYMEAHLRAYLGMAQSATLKNPYFGRQYFDQLELETEKELAQTEVAYKRLNEMLRTHDDAAFLAALKNKIDARPSAPKKSRRRSPPSG